MPQGVVLPAAVACHVVEAWRTGMSEITETVDFVIDHIANSLPVWAAYRTSKTIYRVSPAVGAHCKGTPWPNAVPVSALTLLFRPQVLHWSEMLQRCELAGDVPLGYLVPSGPRHTLEITWATRVMEEYGLTREAINSAVGHVLSCPNHATIPEHWGP